MKKYKNRQNNVNFTEQTTRMEDHQRIAAENCLMASINDRMKDLKQDFSALHEVNPDLASYLLMTFSATVLEGVSGFLKTTRDGIYDLDEIL